jgi:hypothetical protein
MNAFLAMGMMSRIALRSATMKSGSSFRTTARDNDPDSRREGGTANDDGRYAARRGKRSDARRNQQALLDAAAAVFVRGGAGAPVRDIAAEAGVGIATIYLRREQGSGADRARQAQGLRTR